MGDQQGPPLVHLPTRAIDLRRQAAEVVEAARAKADELQAQANRHAEALLAAAEVLEKIASGDDHSSMRTSAQEMVRTNSKRGTLRAMQNAHKVALSIAHSKSRLAVVVGQAGYSLRDFADLPRIGIPESTLRAAHAGKRAIDEEACIRVRDELGQDEHGRWRFPATTDNWPKMRAKKNT